MKILMVCLGNICRSPLADGLLRKKVKEKGLNVIVDSCGTSDYHIGEMPDKRMQQTAKRHNIDISNLRARQFTKDDFKNFDCIYAMDSGNLSDIISLAETKEDINKVKLILNELYINENKSVPDPYFGGNEGFENVFNLLNLACDKIIEKISAS